MLGNPVEVTLQFVERISRHDVDGIAELMAADHVFVDSGGDRHEGRDHMRQGWEQYFRMFPDYRIEVEHTVADGSLVAVFGTATGTYSADGKLPAANRWSCPAAWLAVVEGGNVAEWRVYCDLEALRRIMSGSI